ncbi:TIGR01777 family oxidoreductase [Streptomyces gamaensis]|uniref:TIGR01777 family oxidoreductase n=1 Tax=Streptomyces gamaensis TaxID=1763542 RepID=A0ABW0Z5L2_9ACTN
MRVAITGSTGLIGTALTASLTADGHEVVRLVRRAPRARDEIRWDPGAGRVDAGGLAGCGAVVHLAGAPIGARRWTAAYKKELRDSRVLGTGALARTVAALDPPPRVLVSGSGVGYYGDTGDRPADEGSPAGQGFLPGLCQEWEAAAEPAARAGVRTVLARTGLVVAHHGGAFGRLLTLFSLGLGGRLGDGGQYWSFIGLRDMVAALRWAVDAERLSGPVNFTAPHPLTNREATKVLGQVLKRPTPLPVPAPVLRLVLGEMATSVLTSQRVLPRQLLDSGFEFTCPYFDSAVRAALSDTR